MLNILHIFNIIMSKICNDYTQNFLILNIFNNNSNRDSSDKDYP